jgi:hypothetical protein
MTIGRADSAQLLFARRPRRAEADGLEQLVDCFSGARAGIRIWIGGLGGPWSRRRGRRSRAGWMGGARRDLLQIQMCVGLCRWKGTATAGRDEALRRAVSEPWNFVGGGI